MKTLMQKLFAFALSAIMLVEMIPAVAYAEVGEALVNAGSQAAAELAEGIEEDLEARTGDEADDADAEDELSVDQENPSGEVAPLALDEGEPLAASADVATVGGTGYPDLQSALDAASSGKTKLVVLADNHTLPGDVTVPAGVTLLIPCKDGDTGYVDGYAPNDESATTLTPSLYRTLTIPAGTTLNVEGTVLVNAVVGVAKATGTDQDISGGYGKVALSGSVVVKSGGVYDSQGKTEGSGSIDAQSGSTVRDLFVVHTWRGGTQASKIYKTVYPINEYGSHTIASKLVIRHDARYEGSVTIYTTKQVIFPAQFNHAQFGQVGPDNALIRLDGEQSYIEKTYDSARKMERYTIHGDATFSSASMKLKVNALFTLDLSTKTVVYPWPGTYEFVAESANVTFVNDFKFLPGATFTANGNSKITIAAGKQVTFYDSTYADPYESTGFAYKTNGRTATLTLNGTSTLVNNGKFGGTVVLNGGSLVSGTPSSGVVWGDGETSVAVKEAKEYQGSGTQTFNVKLQREGFTGWTVDPETQVLVWTGADKASLKTAVEAARALTSEPYTPESWETFAGALAEAEALLAREVPTTEQGIVDAALSALTSARGSLEKVTLPLTFDAAGGAWGGGETKVVSVTYGDDLAAFPENPVRAGYTFLGWKLNGEGEILATPPAKVTASATYRAAWSDPIAYGISYTLAGSTDDSDVTWTTSRTSYDVTQGFTLDRPSRVGYEFGGWTLDGAEGEPLVDYVVSAGTTGELAFTAHWTPRTLTVTFRVGEGETILADGAEQPGLEYTRRVTFGSTFGAAGALPSARKLGWQFDGWATESSVAAGKPEPIVDGTTVTLTEDVVLVPRWTKDSYTITYYLDEVGAEEPRGRWPEGVEPKTTYTVTDDFTLPTPEREGHTFLGWRRESEPQSTQPELTMRVPEGTTGTLIFRACWERRENAVSFDYAGGAVLGSEAASSVEQVPYGRTVSGVPSVELPGHRLDGWRTETGELLTEDQVLAAPVTAPVSYTAAWSLIDYALTVTLAEDESWGEAAAPQTTYTVESSITLPVPEKLGHTFTGWSVTGALSGDAELLKSGVIAPGTTGELTFGATWEATPYTVTWDLFSGEDAVSEQIPYGSSVARETPEREGYRFLGWNVEPEGVAELGANGLPTAMPASDLTIEARWENYLETLRDLTSDPSELEDAATLERARELYNTKLSAEQRASYDSTNLMAAIRRAENDAIAAAVSENIDAVNAALSPNGHVIATLFEGEVTDAGLRTLYVEIEDPGYLAKDLLSNPFLEKLFTYPNLETVYIDNEATSSDQFSLMLAVAYATLGAQMGMDLSQFTTWLQSQVNTLILSALSGASVPATLEGKAAPEGPKGEAGYLVRFYNTGEHIDWDTYRTITFESRGGSDVTSYQKLVGMGITEPEAPVREGYAFDGWYRTEQCTGEPFAFTTMPDEDLTLFAKWKANTYALEFSLGEGKGIEGAAPASIEARYDENVELPACTATRLGYTFGGWKLPDASVRQPGARVTKLASEQGATVAIEAAWTPERSTVTLDANGGSVDGKPEKEITVTFDAPYGELPRPEREGYDFVNWMLDGTAVTSATTVTTAGAHRLTAAWNAQGDTPYTVVVYHQTVDGKGYEEISSTKLAAATDSEVTAEVAAPTGFTLNETASLRSGTVAADGSLTLELRYDRDVYDVSFIIGGKREGEHRTFRFGEAVVAPDPGRLPDANASYEFDRWEPELPATATPEIAGKSFTARYHESFEASVNAGDITYRTLELALTHAHPGDVITLERDVTVARNLTVPEDVTLLVPYRADDPGYVPNYEKKPFNPDNTELKGKLGFGGDPAPYRTLTIADGATLSVRGTLLVNALTGRPRSGNYDQEITGGWGKVVVDGRVLVGGKGAYESFGVTEGTGEIRALAGGTVGDLFVVRNWRGGSQALAMFYERVFPFNEYDCVNIEVPVTIEAGGSLVGLVKMYAGSTYCSTRFPLVDPENGLLRQEGSIVPGANRVVRTLDAEGEHFAVTGDTTFSRSTLNIVGEELSTGDFVYPIDGDISYTLENGTFDFTESFKFLTGSKIEAENADLSVSSGSTVVLYEDFADPENTDSTAYPDRPQAALSLDADSTLVNAGTFAGLVEAEEPSVREAKTGVAWRASTKEANGYYYTHFGEEATTLEHALDIEIADHTWEVSPYGEILWDGESSAAGADAITGVAGGGAESLTEADNSLEVSVEKTSEEEVAWTIAITGERLRESADETVQDVVSAFLNAFVRRPEAVSSISTLTGVAPEEVIYPAKGMSRKDVVRFAEKLGFTAGAEANARVRATDASTQAAQASALATGATAADLAGTSAKVLVTGAGENPSKVTFTLRFTAEAAEDAPVVAVYRLHHPVSGAHLLTADENEYRVLQAEAGWKGEDVCFYQYRDAASGGEAVHRLWNPSNGDHHYTTSDEEVAGLVKIGWRDEGAKFYGAVAGGEAVYRLWNSHQTTAGGLGSHLWTASAHEYETLPTLEPKGAWRGENVAWRAVELPKEGA